MRIDRFETKRCIVREITLSDAEQIVSWRSNPSVYQYFRNPIKISIETHCKWFKESYLNNPSRIDYMVCEKSTNQSIGVFGINKGENNVVEVSYLLDDNIQGKGYAAEVLDGLERASTEMWGAIIFKAEIHKNNSKSITFAEKMGYKKENTIGDFIIYKKEKKVYFRCDGNAQIGGGHIMRCLSIANALKELGVESEFIVSDSEFAKTIKDKGFYLIVLETNYKELNKDINLVIDIIKKNAIALVVDSYFVDAEFFDRVRDYAKTIYIDDLIENAYNVDVLINYNIFVR